jgi:hypothetical protein
MICHEHSGVLVGSVPGPDVSLSGVAVLHGRVL